MRSNPFYTREVARWGTAGGRRWLVVYPALAVLATMVVFGMTPARAADLGPTLVLSGCTWLGLLTLAAVTLGLSAWPRERRADTLPALTMAAYPPRRQVDGRWLGAMRSLVPLWLEGGALLLLAAWSLPDFPPSLVVAWLFTAAWAGMWVAFGLCCSVDAQSEVQGLLWMVGLVLLLQLAWALGGELLLRALLPHGPGEIAGTYASASADTWARGFLLCLPGGVFAPAYVAFGPPASVIVALFVAWGLSIALALGICAARLAADAPLRAREMALVAGLRKLIPLGHPIAPESLPTTSIATRVTHRGWVDTLLTPFHRNPFYAAYRNGFMRIYSGIGAMPGSAWPTGFMLWGAVTFVAFEGTRCPEAAVGFLLTGAIPGTLLSALEAFSIGWQALSTERDRATWPLLRVSGMDARTILSGKLAAAFYALHGEWAAVVPVWLAALTTPAPAGVLMILVQPLAICAGFLCGFIAAGAPRGRDLGRAVGWLLAAAIVLAASSDLVAHENRWLTTALFDVHPFIVLLRLAGAAPQTALGVAGMGVLYACGLLTLLALYQVARFCLNRLLREDA